MFYLGFFLGFFACFIFFLTSYVILKAIISKFGIQIREKTENNISKMGENTISTQIIYPDNSKEIFNKENTKIEDLLI